MNFWKNLGNAEKNAAKSALMGLAAAAVFSFFFSLESFAPMVERVYDFFLHFRAKRERINNVVFLDVDDPAVAYNGVFPWPRSITADGLLRLKEYGARAAIFDIEFIDKGPQGVDSIYLNQGLAMDFDRAFSGIKSSASDIFSALKSGRMGRADIDALETDFSGIIDDEYTDLFSRAQGIARDNDLYLAQASALFGKSWVTLNLRSDELSGEQAERRSLAEERFSQSIHALPSARKGPFIDILPPLPSFAQAGKGAGYTNVEIDVDGVRRRIYLAQNVYDHWYFQLAFAPLMDYLGSPQIELSSRKLAIKGARLPGGEKDIVIPLDGEGRMMLDWPPEDYVDSYRHVSFYEFSQLEEIEAKLEAFSREFLYVDIPFFAQFDPDLAAIPIIVWELDKLFDSARAAKALALEDCSDEAFDEYLECRSQSRSQIQRLLDLDPGTRVMAVAASLAEQDVSSSGAIKKAAEDIEMISGYLAGYLDWYSEISSLIEEAVRDNFCILGRVDTGTTDYGANPFWGKYNNVGTHGVVLDTILSESFITPLNMWWRIMLTLLLTPLLFLVTASFAPVRRAVFGFSGALLIFIGAILIFRFTGVFFPPLGIVLAIITAAVIRETISYAGSEREKKFYRKAFATYTSEAVADEIARNPSLLQLGGTKRRMSALFTDIRGFSTISEQLAPEDLVNLLNRYLTAMSNIILDEQGTIDKYEGDAIIAFFGAPLEQPDHALLACLSAVKIKQAEEVLNKAVAEQNLSPVPLYTRIGINTGDMVAGNMGTEKKMNYTIMGDAVNLAARLEGVNKQYGTWILASGDTIRQTEGRLLVRRLDKVRVVGKSEPVQLFNVLNILEEAPEEQKKQVTLFHEALDYFEQRSWEKAADGFRELLSIEENGPAPLYLKRCEQYLKKTPDDSWDGVFNLTEK
ncbi:MAG: adenylate/guanylate cyclase domain-containing protein [Treponema sp.]|nr:adenylate/guanylate cyclase domain-containing protein [Treponema sp.]